MAENKTTDPQKKQGIFKYLDNTFGDDGLKTEVKITLTNMTLLKIIGGAVVATTLSTLVYFSIKHLFKKPQLVTIYDPTIHG